MDAYALYLILLKPRLGFFVVSEENPAVMLTNGGKLVTHSFPVSPRRRFLVLGKQTTAIGDVV